jgi:hypothetical protein
LPHSGARSLPNKTGYGLTKENTTKKQTYATSQEMIDDLKGWMVRYDFYRPHRQLGRKTPYEAVCDWHKKEPDRFLKEPSSLLAYHTDRSQPPET